MPDDSGLKSAGVYGTAPAARRPASLFSAGEPERGDDRPGPGALGSRRFSRLTLRILAIGIFPLATIFGGLMYLGVYERSLVDGRLLALGTEARMIAGALGETAVPPGDPETTEIEIETARNVLRRLVRPTRVRARLFSRDGVLIADSRALLERGGAVRQETLPPPEGPSRVLGVLTDVYDWFFFLLSQGRDRAAVYRETPYESAADYEEVRRALGGDDASMVRVSERDRLILSFAIPVQRYKNIYGALMLSISSAGIDRSVREVRQDIVQVFGIVFILSLLLSFYLARAISQPIARLAAAADRMRRLRNRSAAIPAFPDRRDEIGDLSAALGDLTTELFDRMDAIERFAADVSHELKNPLSSLRSAVETAARIDDPEKQKRLMAVIEQDVDRLDRLITDIANASRLDAELARLAPGPVDLRQLLHTLAEVYRTTAKDGAAEIRLELPATGGLIAQAVEDRLVQVLRNLVANAESFSPPDGTIRIAASAGKSSVTVTVEDEGPGIAPGKEEEIFERFYSERPVGEAFGQHSGLGLSISRQIVEAVGGALRAENIPGPDGSVRGARFTITLPRLSGARMPGNGGNGAAA
ncbi:MAG: HAMP domain-containing protein [Rhodospirillaceae bacterium]|nr:HAMP domain-containing protein [Rhodospirillaceae bacterium]MYH37604.1 HAMP domain-containing protein [Rhodospirillaceae bacterium]MYK13374.1 HAMP domain-containing protein [Rhodospirillaceae bacterium]MYK60345.1 HAMP domain-containing protein [Rhodospirillaceae bacterium]